MSALHSPVHWTRGKTISKFSRSMQTTSPLLKKGNFNYFWRPQDATNPDIKTFFTFKLHSSNSPFTFSPPIATPTHTAPYTLRKWTYILQLIFHLPHGELPTGICQKVERAALWLLLCPACSHSSASAKERRCKAPLGENKCKRNSFQWDGGIRVAKPSHVL